VKNGEGKNKRGHPEKRDIEVRAFYTKALLEKGKKRGPQKRDDLEKEKRAITAATPKGPNNKKSPKP